jgi:hypothetical protein
MPYRVLADLVLALHLGFIAFALAGGLLALRWRRCAWVHVPAAVWAALVELRGWLCPLTPLEGWLRRAGGGAEYEAGFLEHWLAPVIYPAGLTHDLQVLLGSLVVAVNASIYLWVWRSRARRPA